MLTFGLKILMDAVVDSQMFTDAATSESTLPRELD